MQRAFIIIHSCNHTDMLINPDRVTCVEEKENGCIIHFDQGNYIQTTASFQDVVDGMERSGGSSELPLTEVPI